MTLNLTSRESVLKAIAEFDQLGRDGFLERYGFGRARDFYVVHEGRYYDSKAIAGVAQASEPGSDGPLKAEQFSGGEATVRRALEDLNFIVVRLGTTSPADRLPLVLVQNEVTAGGKYDFWADDTGIQYHYPNHYKNRVEPGRPFVYYKGVRRQKGRRGAPVYFGAGVVGEVWRDPQIPEAAPRRTWRWYCSIEEYVSFPNHVQAKLKGQPIENIDSPAGWRNAVREIPWHVYQEIMELGGVPPTAPQLPLPPLSTVTPTVCEDLVELLITRTGEPGPAGGGGGMGFRAPAQTKEIGDRAEELVYRWLRASLPKAQADSVDWVAQRGEKPGWDVEYRDAEGDLVGVEVKGTTLSRFGSIELTDNEWSSAQDIGPNYRLALVAAVASKSPKLLLIADPAARVDSGSFKIRPVTWRIIRSE